MTNDSLKNIRLKNFAVLAGILLVFQLVSAAIGFATMDGIDGWYQGLTRSALNPPGWVFATVWPVLYALMAVSLWLIWMRRHEFVVTPALMLFGLHMLINWAWSFIFFDFHLLAVSFFWVLGTGALAAAICFIFMAIRPLAAWLLVPYMGWLCFAAYLSWFVWQNN